MTNEPNRIEEIFEWATQLKLFRNFHLARGRPWIINPLPCQLELDGFNNRNLQSGTYGNRPTIVLIAADQMHLESNWKVYIFLVV